MNLIIILVFVFAMLHFIYEAIVAPSLRLSIRYRLFRLRDEMRDLKFNNPEKISDEVFSIVDDGLSFNINNLPNINFYLVAQTQERINRIPALKVQIDHRMRLVTECEVDEVRTLLARSSKYVLNAILLNSGAWFFYLIPFSILLIPFMMIFEMVKKLKIAIKDILFTPAKELSKYILTTEETNFTFVPNYHYSVGKKIHQAH